MGMIGRCGGGGYFVNILFLSSILAHLEYMSRRITRFKLYWDVSMKFNRKNDIGHMIDKWNLNVEI